MRNDDFNSTMSRFLWKMLVFLGIIMVVVLLAGCWNNPVSPACGWRYTSYKGDMTLGDTLVHITPTDSVYSCQHREPH